MIRRPRLLDLFCGAGGCSVGYYRAGFEVVGVDHRPMPRYPFKFHQADALAFVAAHGREFDVIHASPPCQVYSSTRTLPNMRKDHADLLGPARKALIHSGRPWVIENVDRAPMCGIMLCGLMFGLRVFRHRLFESSELLLCPSHAGHGDKRVGRGIVCVAGNGGAHSTGWPPRRRPVPADHRNKAAWSRAMRIDWMTRDELAQAIPPTYTEYVGRQLLNILAR